MRLLSFQARHFGWTPHSRTIDDADPEPVEQRVEEAVVVFLHAETRDESDGERKRVFRHVLKHVKWIAGKREWKRIVLHSFTHLGGENASPEFARGLMLELAERLESTGYEVHLTPFGWFCAWELSVLGESLAKVWKEV